MLLPLVYFFSSNSPFPLLVRPPWVVACTVTVGVKKEKERGWRRLCANMMEKRDELLVSMFPLPRSGRANWNQRHFPDEWNRRLFGGVGQQAPRIAFGFIAYSIPSHGHPRTERWRMATLHYTCSGGTKVGYIGSYRSNL